MANVKSETIHELVNATKHAPARSEKVYARSPLIAAIQRVSKDMRDPTSDQAQREELTRLMDELNESLALAWPVDRVPMVKDMDEPAFTPDGPARWIPKDQIAVTKDGQIRKDQSRSATSKEFKELYLTNPYRLPPAAVFEIPEDQREAFGGKEYLLSDAYARLGAIDMMRMEADGCDPWAIVPAYVIPFDPKVKASVLDQSLYVAAALNNTEHPDDMDKAALRLGGLRLYSTGAFSQASIAARLGVAPTVFNDWVRVKTAQDLLIRAGCNHEILSPIPEGANAGQSGRKDGNTWKPTVTDTALLFCYKVLTAPVPKGTEAEDEDRMRADRFNALRHLINDLGYTSPVQFKQALEGWEMDHLKIVNAQEWSNVPNASGQKSGPKPSATPAPTNGAQTVDRAKIEEAKRKVEELRAKVNNADTAPDERPKAIEAYTAAVHDLAVAETQVKAAPQTDGDPFVAFGSAIVAYLHGEDETGGNLLAVALDAKITTDLIDQLVRGLGKVHQGLKNHAKELEARQAKEAAEKDMAEVK